MDKDSLLNMDSYMSLSIVNMKLRDEFSSLEDLASYYNIEIEVLEKKFRDIGYSYDNKTNSFTA
ncbi:hypothetical protein J2Z44_001780 [Clostridium punense]|uniref:DUF4250 domain-containing protein n=1 Tax=Clostridium punense TaxID=1054297 RepID=A0ABS4K5Q8_9CLOT|nr:DUF4250 domain-containing protein [Clostridium punense]MBP2021979.1 hypothetical protein [Clostridium punense]